jgi:hypothetical protein
MKKCIVSIGFLLVGALPAWALFYALPYAIEKDNLGGVVILEGGTPFPTNAVVRGAATIRYSTKGKYLKVVNGVVVPKTPTEKAFVDLPAKYKKLVDKTWVEMTAEEKHLVDLPDKYKNPDGSEMKPEQKAAVDAALEAARQEAKPVMLKQIENVYVPFLENEWTTVLREKRIIAPEYTVNVTNTTYDQNMTYLMTLRAMDKETYIKFASEFKIFDDTVREKFGASTGDAVIHK